MARKPSSAKEIREVKIMVAAIIGCGLLLAFCLWLLR